jgi:glucokinase
MPSILAGDVGGTKTLLAIFEPRDGGLDVVREQRFASGEHGSLREIVARFLAADPRARPEAACFGVAGPVVSGICQATNLPWRIDAADLLESGRTANVELINDMEAAAYGMLHVGQDRLAPLNPGARSVNGGNVAVLAAGTGLGESILYWDGREHHVVASEGGHADFAPHTDREIELLRFLRVRYGGHVSYERVLSGPGLHNIYAFLRASTDADEPGWLRDALLEGDPPAVIARAGLEEEDPVCVEALEMFAHVYGVEAGNLALKCLALGGVYLGGGIAPRILSVLRRGSFMRGFSDKGRLSGLLEQIPVAVSLDTRTALIGAAHCALRAWSERAS